MSEKKINIFVYLIMIMMTIGCLVVGVYCALDTTFSTSGEIAFSGSQIDEDPYQKYYDEGYVLETADNFDYKNGAIYKYNGTNAKIILPEIDGVYAIMGQNKTSPLSSNDSLDVSTYNSPIHSSTYAPTVRGSGISDIITHIVIPKSYTVVGGASFASTFNSGGDVMIFESKITNVVMLGVQNIASDAFYGCENLTSITISPGVTTIGEYAFDDCRNLATITIPSSVSEIGVYAFNMCLNLGTIVCESSNVGTMSIGMAMYFNFVSKDGTTTANNISQWQTIAGVYTKI